MTGIPGASGQCFRCQNAAVHVCQRCGQEYCERHGKELCSECIANLRTEHALGLSFRGCLLGLVVGAVIVVTLALVAPGLLAGTGPAIGLILILGALSFLLAFAFALRLP
jgi:hypothetical protein